MKELSIEEKAKAYDEAIKRAQKVNLEMEYSSQKGVVEYIFPELKESEDERIRKEIIDFLGLPHPQFVGKRDHEKWIAWLEKQGEQKPAAKVEPKFKVGDWVVNKLGDLWHIDSSDKKNYQVSDGKGNYNYFPISKQEEMRLWTIQDAKDGDMLEFGDHGRLVTGILSFVNKTTGKVDVSCLLEGDKFKVGVFYNLDTVKPHPATKEQRDLLFKKMKEAGYEWNADKKQLKKIEQKSDTQHSTEWSVSDFRTWQYIVSDVLTKKDGIGQYLDSGECKKIAKYMQEEWGEKLGKEQTQEELCKGEDYGIDGLYHAISILEKTLGKVDGYQSDDGILEHKCAINAIKEFYEHKPAWSEEDEDILNTIINHFKVNVECTDDDDIIKWLKSLKDRVQP